MERTHKMSGRRLSYVFFFLAVAIIGVSGEAGSVSFSDTTVTLTCPITATDPEKVKWYKNKDIKPDVGTSLTLIDYDDNKDGGLYHCTEDENTKYHFYIKAKVCKGCVDMDMSVAMAMVFGDVLITAGIALMVYFCARRKAETAAPQRATQARQARGQARGPTPPDPDYQPLNPATRANDVYAHPQRR
ncbi:T-cell surface glycoprotein CD3 epsilon chain-like [Clarias gariepinus]|uniref:T-cell surface glycoprotein CD3 epsilon chain-like n=1 Tax=Clarias gariepinus TaxID=13013 RepID=UPI00234C6043|nr:T-cell surface glycoprotein CD3 epsilon chain-like [Clarias gariepinus]